MPYYFTCPGCRQNNYGYEYRPVGTSYYDELQCTRCGLKDITWVASSGLNVNVPARLLAVGSHESPIGYMDPQVATGDLESAILPRLRGSASLVAPYSQGQRSKAFTPNVSSVGEGQCAGQVLHWIRKVLQGGREHYLSPQQKGNITRTDTELANKYKKQHLFGAKAQVMLTAAKGPAGERRLAEFDAKFESQVVPALARQGIVKTTTGWSYPHEKEAVFNRAMDARNQLVEKMNNEGFFSYGWEQLARELDEMVNRYGGSSRTFSNIVAVKCINRSDTRFGDGTARAFAAAITGDTEFKIGRAAYLSLGLRIGIGESGGSISGHAVGVHFKSAGELYMFDPNLGIFQSSSKDQLKQALTTLMGTVWTQDLHWALNGTFGFAMFKANVTNEVTAPTEVPVTYNASPIVTAMENTARGAIPNSSSIIPTGGGSTSPNMNVTRTRVAPQSPPRTIGGGTPNNTNTTPTPTGNPTPTGARSRVADLARRFGNQ